MCEVVSVAIHCVVFPNSCSTDRYGIKQYDNHPAK